MFNIKVCTFSSVQKEFGLIEKAYAYQYLLMLIKAIDAEEVIMTDGLTGEVLYLWRQGHWEVFDGVII